MEQREIPAAVGVDDILLYMWLVVDAFRSHVGLREEVQGNSFPVHDTRSRALNRDRGGGENSLSPHATTTAAVRTREKMAQQQEDAPSVEESDSLTTAPAADAACATGVIRSKGKFAFLRLTLFTLGLFQTIFDPKPPEKKTLLVLLL